MKNGVFLVTAVFAVIGLSFSCSGDENPDDTDLYAERMQAFVKEISDYAKAKKPDFIIIPQNGSELIYNHTDPGEGIRDSYVNAIDGMGIEELFYDSDGNKISANDEDQKERLAALRKIRASPYNKTIMVSDYAPDSGKIDNSVAWNKDENFISFPRSADNFEYEYIPDSDPAFKNTDDITALNKARNYLCLIGADVSGSKTVYLSKIKETDYDVVLIDLFHDDAALTENDVDDLRTKHGGGTRLVIAYINIGALETFRYYWTETLNETLPSWAKKEYDGWPGEYWAEFWNQEWKDIIFGKTNSYMDRIIEAGFDGAYLDNVEAYYFLLND